MLFVWVFFLVFILLLFGLFIPLFYRRWLLPGYDIHSRGDLPQSSDEKLSGKVSLPGGCHWCQKRGPWKLIEGEPPELHSGECFQKAVKQTEEPQTEKCSEWFAFPQ